jgi:hypothetical protein
MKDLDKDEALYVPCVWCGREINKDIVCKRKQRKDEQPDQCKDCRDVRKPADTSRFRKVVRTHPKLGKIECRAWNGEIDDNWNPIDENGELYRPGERICGAKDCVDIHHIIAAEPLTVSDTELILGMHEMQQHNRKVRTK